MNQTRREFLKKSAGFAAGAALGGNSVSLRAAAPAAVPEPFFLTRGVVLVPNDFKAFDWAGQAAQAGLNTIGVHGGFPASQEFLQACRQRSLGVEYELHALNGLLPRKLFATDPEMFRMDQKGKRQQGSNLCVHSEKAVQIVCDNAVRWTQTMKPGTGRHFFWIDDGQPMCRCEKCREFSDSDQALMLENRMLTALRRDEPNATLAHLAYAMTLPAPTKVKPLPGIFLEFAPYYRKYDRPLAEREVVGMSPGRDQPVLTHGQLLDILDANLAVFGSNGAQMLEYWLDRSRFLRERVENANEPMPWNQEVLESDLKTYAARGIRHITSFGVKLDADYAQRFGNPPVESYGKALQRWRLIDGKPVQEKA